MATPLAIVAYLALFATVAAVFLFANLVIGRLVRPNLPNKEKLEVYECGEPVIGSSFVQFDLRFYVVALLFIIFDVEVAFFFPWATVFGKAVQLSSPDMQIVAEMEENFVLTPQAVTRLEELGVHNPEISQFTGARDVSPKTGSADSGSVNSGSVNSGSVNSGSVNSGSVNSGSVDSGSVESSVRGTAQKIALTSLADIGVFFAVLLVGFAYVWKRGDLNWVRAVTSQEGDVVARAPPQASTPVARPAGSILSA